MNPSTSKVYRGFREIGLCLRNSTFCDARPIRPYLKKSHVFVRTNEKMEPIGGFFTPIGMRPYLSISQKNVTAIVGLSV
jgi:hypothetical protein